MSYSTDSKADLYYSELMKDASQAGSILMKFFCEIYDLMPNRTDLVMFNDLVESYGKNRVFKAVLQLNNRFQSGKNPRYLRGALKRILTEDFENEKKFEQSIKSVDLDDYVVDRNKKVKELSKEKLIIPKVFEDE